MLGIDDKERGITPDSRATGRGAGPAHHVSGPLGADAGALPKYWVAEQKTHRVVLKGFNFDFIPTGDGTRGGTVEGRWFASGHDGKYELVKSDWGSLQIRVQFGKATPTEDMDAVLFVEGTEAWVVGTIQGKVADPKARARVSGAGTESAPFHVQFTAASLAWFVQS